MNKRGFLGLFGGALSSAALSGIPVAPFLKDEKKGVAEQDTPYEVEKITELLQREEYEDTRGHSKEEDTHGTARESFEGLSNSKHFIMEIVAQADRYERELSKVLDYATLITQSDPAGRNRMEYLQEMLTPKGVPEAAVAEIRKQVVGLGFEESRYDAARESGEKARGVLQIIPSTWADLSKEGESVYSLVDQTRVAGELFSQTYAYLHNTVGVELQAIETEFFHGDSEKFQRCFIAPVLINAYNAGMGTMAKLIQWFARTYGTEERTVGLFGQEEILSDYDIFMAMAKKGKTENAVPLYKEDASAYTFKVYGAAMCLLRHQGEEQSA